MKKVDFADKEAFEFYKEIVAKKSSNANLLAIEDDVEQSYILYKGNFQSNTLHLLQPLIASNGNKNDLKELYSLRKKAFRELFVELTTDSSNRRDMLCPNCTLSDCSQLDHYMPKSLFPEFSANPHNLMQCCSICNQKKSGIWLRNGQAVFLNLYLDELPKEQYLFVRIHMDNEIPSFVFYLDKPKGIVQNLFDRIKSHYEQLGLCKRFAEKSDSVISELITEYAATLETPITSENFWELKRKSATLERVKKGYNYWKSVLVLACCDNSSVRASIEKIASTP